MPEPGATCPEEKLPMLDYTLAHLSDEALLRELTMLVTKDRETTAALVAHIAEVDARRAYVPQGYPSMFAYCVEHLRFSEDAASKRIQAARAARRVPALLTALAEGRLHLSAVWLLAPHVTRENADELIEAATHRRKSEIEVFLAVRFPRLGAPIPATIIAPVRSGLLRNGASATSMMFDEHAPGHVESSTERDEHAPGHVESERDEHAPGHVDDLRQETLPSAERYLVRLTIDKNTHEKLRYAQVLLSHAIPSGDVAQVLGRALDALITNIEERKLGAAPSTRRRSTGAPRPSSGRNRSDGPATRHIPVHIRRAVWVRDQGRCTFVGAGGHRCESRRLLEFDHVEPFARGGTATADGIRLRCRAHNQFEAERAFGVEFMRGKREEARRARPTTRGGTLRYGLAERAAEEERRRQAQDIRTALRGLGCRAVEARRAAERAASLEGATLEERMRAALSFLAPRSNRIRTTAPAEHVRERAPAYRIHRNGDSHFRARRVSCRERRVRRIAHATLARCTPSPTRSAT
jgi:hypothetical protein